MWLAEVGGRRRAILLRRHFHARQHDHPHRRRIDRRRPVPLAIPAVDLIIVDLVIVIAVVAVVVVLRSAGRRALGGRVVSCQS